MLRVVALVLVVLVTSIDAHAMTRNEARAVLADATLAFEDGVSRLRRDPEGAEARLREAAGLYEAILERSDFHSAGLHYNTGNAYLLVGDLGRAIAAYRRAQLLDPRDDNIAHNLEWARSRVPNRFDTGVSSGGFGEFITNSALSWHHAIPPRTRFWLAIGLFASVWIIAIARVALGGLRFSGFAMGTCLVLSLLLAASVVHESLQRERVVRGVVVAESVPGRKGPSTDGYGESFTRPLTSGVEFTLVGRRPEWVFVELLDGRETWLPATAVEFI
ncbi:MAG: tetratricopeptide repeat protein [Planctomycetota bacterium]